MLNLVSLSTQSLASCVNYFCLELFTVFFQHENRFRYKFFRYCSIFKVLCAAALAADDLIILPQKRFFVKHFFEKLLKFCELGALQASQCQLVFSASIGSFQGLPAGALEVILLPQRLALKYNTTPPAFLSTLFDRFFPFFFAHDRKRHLTVRYMRRSCFGAAWHKCLFSLLI